MLELRHISKTFYPGTVHEKTALQDLSLTLQTGDFVTILGSNGAGKSTLFNAVAGGFAVDSGRIVLDGQELTGMPDYKRSKFIGRMFQDPMRGTAPNMTIEENLALAFLRTNGKSSPFSVITRADRAAFREKLAQLGLGLEDRMQQPVGLLHVGALGGEGDRALEGFHRQRVHRSVGNGSDELLRCVVTARGQQKTCGCEGIET